MGCDAWKPVKHQIWLVCVLKVRSRQQPLDRVKVFAAASAVDKQRFSWVAVCDDPSPDGLERLSCDTQP